ncbi:sialidase family protein [Allorhodopirellula heiligendammensis]|uniref:exo-alpha-sialidase n=1 Tax=Allorhodopirellula heiligendammensis TaxID=2714739 RepID=A0A5C6BZ35_9BACT|nr:sialidase family protein [Allorhodopirellula heiligendammensis]TWU16546.1 BNR/Asp-box repeat protein [Allorhodopirellula heiligendammensis]
MSDLSRRQFVAASASTLLASSITRASDDSSRHQVGNITTISLESDRYHGWPTLCRCANGDLVVVCSGGRESHVCPFGRVDLMRSRDTGESWSYERTILDGPIDDRDAGIVETDQGTLLVSTFSSLAYEPRLQTALATAASDKPSMPAQQLAKWQAVQRRLPAGEHEKHRGCWMLRSEDGGLNWSPAYRVPLNSPHGPIQLSDGTLFYAGVALWDSPRSVGTCRSSDDGRTWTPLEELPTRPGDDPSQYHELHAVEAADGRLIVHIRNHNAANQNETLQTHSTDHGKTWATPYSIGVWGLPSHLLRLSDDRLLMTYGHRRAPLGNQARISDDHGRTWSAPMIVSGDATSGDVGYPSTAEVSPGKLVTVWYERLAGNANAQLRLASWELPN